MRLLSGRHWHCTCTCREHLFQYMSIWLVSELGLNVIQKSAASKKKKHDWIYTSHRVKFGLSLFLPTHTHIRVHKAWTDTDTNWSETRGRFAHLLLTEKGFFFSFLFSFLPFWECRKQTVQSKCKGRKVMHPVTRTIFFTQKNENNYRLTQVFLLSLILLVSLDYFFIPTEAKYINSQIIRSGHLRQTDRHERFYFWRGSWRIISYLRN